MNGQRDFISTYNVKQNTACLVSPPEIIPPPLPHPICVFSLSVSLALFTCWMTLIASLLWALSLSLSLSFVSPLPCLFFSLWYEINAFSMDQRQKESEEPSKPFAMFWEESPSEICLPVCPPYCFIDVLNKYSFALTFFAPLFVVVRSSFTVFNFFICRLMKSHNASGKYLQTSFFLFFLMWYVLLWYSFFFFFVCSVKAWM